MSISRKVTHWVDVEVPFDLVFICFTEQFCPPAVPDFRIRSADCPSTFAVPIFHCCHRIPILQEAQEAVHRHFLARQTVLGFESERVIERDDPSVEKTAFPEVHQTVAGVGSLLDFNLGSFRSALSPVP